MGIRVLVLWDLRFCSNELKIYMKKIIRLIGESNWSKNRYWHLNLPKIFEQMLNRHIKKTLQVDGVKKVKYGWGGPRPLGAIRVGSPCAGPLQASTEVLAVHFQEKRINKTQSSVGLAALQL